MGIMTQDVFLFSGTIRENIRYGRLEASEEEIIRAAKAVHAHEFIMKMEKGYDTELKERGAGLSDVYKRQGYGQGELLVNPIHLASIYSAFVNEGNMILPVLQMEEGQQAEYWLSLIHI